MRRFLLVLVLLGAFAAGVAAQSFNLTITVTAAQRVAVQVIVARVNAQRAAQTPPLPALTVQQYVQARIDELLDNYVTQIVAEDADGIAGRARRATQAQRDAAKAQLPPE